MGQKRKKTPADYSEPIISISGIRGTIPEQLRPETLISYIEAFALSTGKRIVTGKDSRATGTAIEQLIHGVLLAAGKEIISVGLAATPTVKATVQTQKADAGIIITASHNPPEYNGLKFLKKGGFFFEKPDFEKWHLHLQTVLTRNTTTKSAARQADKSNSNRTTWKNYKAQGLLHSHSGDSDHIKSILNGLDIERIRQKKYAVLIDAVGGAGRNSLPALLSELGCKIIPLFCDDNHGVFPRPPEPTPAALKEFSRRLKSENDPVDIGFALDPDADRLVPGSPGSGAIHEEYTLPLSYLGYENLPRGPIVVNLSTANLIDQVSDRTVFRSAVGEANVVALMKKKKAVFGGEGNGGLIDPFLPSFGRDSLAAAARILNAMTIHNAATLDDLLEKMPPLYMEKTKISLAGMKTSPENIFKKIEKIFPEATFNKEDGLHISFQEPATEWVHIRASNTEPILRIIAQADSKKNLKNLINRVQKTVSGTRT